jgi:hypothetical protein
MTDFLVRRDDLRAWKAIDGDEPDTAGPDELRLRVERFGLTANNVTYGLLGEQLDYWRFYPAPDGWGRIPVWGFGEVTASGVDGIDVGERFYGYFPMSSAVTLQAKARPDGFADASPGRDGLPAIYNRYLAAMPEQGFLRAHDDANVVLRPLFMTGWLIADHLDQERWYGADAIVLASASSKTAFSTAFEVAGRDGAPAVVGLTSPANRAFTEGLGCYDRVLTYDDLGALSGEVVFFDIAGSPAVRRAVHEHASVRASFVVGATHWETASFGGGGQAFSTAAHSERRARELGPGEFLRRLNAAWTAFADRAPELLEIETATGVEALGRTYTAFLDGTADPRKGYVFTL